MNGQTGSTYRAFLVDVDGVLARGTQAIPGAVEALAILQGSGRVTLFTNNSTRSRGRLSSHLASLGFSVAAEDIFASSWLAARYLSEREGEASVWVIGEDGLRRELADAGHRLAEQPEAAAWVVAGMDRRLDYAKLTSALQALLGGARLLATNEDATYPTPTGVVPGAGAIVGALRGMGFAPDALVGKPSPLAFELALRALAVPVRDVLMIGDRLETDVAGGASVGMDTALVLSGVSTRAEIARTAIRPTWVADDLAGVAAGRMTRTVGE